MRASLHVYVYLHVCLLDIVHLVRFGQLLRYADKRIVTIMKVYIERNSLQVEVVRCRNFFGSIYVYFLRSEVFNIIQLVRCHVSSYCSVYVYSRYRRNMCTIIMLTGGIINIFCWSPNHATTLCR